MSAREKEPYIKVVINGFGANIVKGLVMQHYPTADIKIDTPENNGLYKDIKVNKTPGSVLESYRLREGLSIIDLAKLTGIKYTNISAMQANRRVIGLKSAKRLAEVLKCNYTVLLDI